MATFLIAIAFIRDFWISLGLAVSTFGLSAIIENWKIIKKGKFTKSKII